MRFSSLAVAGCALLLSAAAADAQSATTPAKPAASSKTPTNARPADATAAKPADPGSSEPQSTSAVYGDWILRCNNSVSPGKSKVCEVVQTLLDQNRNKIAEIALGRAVGKEKSTDEIRIVIVLGNNVAFNAPVKMTPDEKEQAIDLEYRRCMPIGCFADAVFSNETAARWKARTDRGRLSYVDGANREIVLPFSLRGFRQAFDALLKS